MEPKNPFEDPRFFAWFEERPEVVRAAILEFPPDRFYRIKSSGHVVSLWSYAEHVCMGEEDCDKKGTVTVTAMVLKKHNPDITFERLVFGVPTSELEELPMEEQPLYGLSSRPPESP